MNIPPHFVLHPDVKSALQARKALVALESAVITHGLPQPENLILAQQLEQEVRAQQATPATIALLHGQVHIGLTDDELNYLSSGVDYARKISVRDFGVAIARRENGGTTVAATLAAAHRAGVRVFATGGIGGVHRDAPFDMSADLPALASYPLLVVCAGAKAILDLPATLETLETMGVAVVGYQTDEFPAFYSASSGLKLMVSAQTPAEVAAIARAQWELGISSAVLVVQPPPAEAALPREQVDAVIDQAVREAAEKGVRGAAVTPFLLARVSELSGGASLRTNLALLRNNACLAAQIAAQLVERPIDPSV